MGNTGIIYKQQDYQDAFTRGLEQLLDSNGLGIFILVLANTTNGNM